MATTIPMSPMRSRRIPTASPGCSRWTCWRPTRARRIRYWVGRKLTGLRLFTIGSTMTDQASWLDDPKSYPAWQTAVDLGIPICLQMSPTAFPQMIRMIERFPKAKIILDHCARPVLNDGPPYAAGAKPVRSRQYPNIHLKLTQRNFTESQSGKATPETFFPQAGRPRSAPTGWPGARTIRRPKARSPICWRSPSARSPAAAERPGLDFCQDRADAVSRAGRLRDLPWPTRSH